MENENQPNFNPEPNAKSRLANLSRKAMQRTGHDMPNDIVVSDWDMRFLSFHNPFNVAKTVIQNNYMALNALEAHLMVAKVQEEAAKKQLLRQQIVKPFGN